MSAGSAGRRGRFTLQRKLLLGFAAAGGLVVGLAIVGDRVIHDAETRMNATLRGEVRPLARLNRLQTQLNRLRVLEVELPRLTDLFAVSDQASLIAAERGEFDRDLGQFVAEWRAYDAGGAARLDEYWKRYQADLRSSELHAARMELEAAQRIATYESAARFRALSRTLRELAESTERRAEESLRQAVLDHERQRLVFVATSAFGLFVLAAWIGLLARSVTTRLSRLRDAAARLADGEASVPIPVGGNDELTELGAAFESMQDKLFAREQALRASHEQLEQKIAERTRELHDANAKLLHEVEERRRIQERLHHQAQYDNLTELPNRVLALDRLGQAIHAAERSKSQVTVMFLDLDDFKKVNDTLGHAFGDALLVQAARRLKRAVRAEDTVARLGGDEFLVILAAPALAEKGRHIAQQIVSAFEPAFEIGGSEVVVSASVGAATFPEDGEDPAALLRNADLAMYDAKAAGRSTYRFYDARAHGTTLQRLSIESDLRGAIERGELRLCYQPIVATATRELVGVEALLRWQRRASGLALPDEFIAVAESSGLIIDIGDWVLESVCAQLASWREHGHTGLRAALNVSPRQFRDNPLPAAVRRCLGARDIPPGLLQLEVTEGLLVRNHPEVLETLLELSALGVELALDDFGTGYSSLSYLKRFPFRAIKVDREFVRDLATDPDDRALVTAAIHMGKGLGLRVTAEGVETEEQLEFLASQGCDLVQGFLFGAPLPAGEFAARWLAGKQAAA